jgi:Glycosyl transferase family 2
VIGDRWVVPRAPAGLQPLDAPPSFAVVVRTYQDADVVGGALESLRRQTVPAEVIVVDDGSSDDVEGAVAPYADVVTLVRVPHGGASLAFNVGLETAQADFVAFLDADDAFHPRRIEALGLLAAARPDLDVLVTDARFLVDGRQVGTFYEHNRFEVVDQRASILGQLFVPWLVARRERLRAVGGMDPAVTVGEDWDLAIRLILTGSSAGLVDAPYYDYVLRPGSVSAARIASLQGRILVLEKVRRLGLARPEEDGVLEEALRTHRSRLVTARLQAAVGTPGARRLAARSAVTPGLWRRVRLAAAASVVQPALANRLLAPDVPPDKRFR